MIKNHDSQEYLKEELVWMKRHIFALPALRRLTYLLGIISQCYRLMQFSTDGVQHNLNERTVCVMLFLSILVTQEKMVLLLSFSSAECYLYTGFQFFFFCEYI